MRLAPGHRRWTVLAAVPPAAASAVVGPPGLALLVLPAAVLLFFRDPERTPEGDGVLAPADGRVTVLDEEADPDEGVERLRLGVFMGPTDVHVNRAPITGRVVERTHHAGGHWPAFAKASERNERVVWRLADGGEEVTDGARDEPAEHEGAGTAGPRYEVVQIAGTVARRITPYRDGGDVVEGGERLGHIAFGSRVDVVFPAAVGREDLAVAVGDTVRAGETVVLPDAARPDAAPDD